MLQIHSSVQPRSPLQPELHAPPCGSVVSSPARSTDHHHPLRLPPSSIIFSAGERGYLGTTVRVLLPLSDSAPSSFAVSVEPLVLPAGSAGPRRQWPPPPMREFFLLLSLCGVNVHMSMICYFHTPCICVFRGVFYKLLHAIFRCGLWMWMFVLSACFVCVLQPFPTTKFISATCFHQRWREKKKKKEF